MSTNPPNFHISQAGTGPQPIVTLPAGGAGAGRNNHLTQAGGSGGAGHVQASQINTSWVQSSPPQIRCPICNQMGEPGLSAGSGAGNPSLLGCSRCTAMALAQTFSTLASIQYPDKIFTLYPDEMNLSQLVEIQVTNHACWKSNAPVYLKTSDGARWDLPWVTSGVDDREMGNKPVCQHCSNQLACLAGIHRQAPEAWDLVASRETINLPLV